MYMKSAGGVWVRQGWLSSVRTTGCAALDTAEGLDVLIVPGTSVCNATHNTTPGDGLALSGGHGRNLSQIKRYKAEANPVDLFTQALLADLSTSLSVHFTAARTSLVVRDLLKEGGAFFLLPS